VITPVKNGEQFLKETMESVLGQKGDFSLEYIIVDGGSTDGTLAIIENYRQKVDSGAYTSNCNSIALRIVSQIDESMYQAVSTGLEMATGDIICYINADDFYFPNAFSTVAHVFDTFEEVKWITGYPVRYNTKGEVIRVLTPFHYQTDFIKQGFYGTTLPFIQQESVFWRRELNAFINWSEFRKFKLAGDYYLWHSFALNQQHLVLVESLLSGNRLRSGQLSEDRDTYFQEFNSIRSKPGIVNILMAYVIKIMEKIAGQSIKRALARNRIVFGAGEWIKN